MINIGPVLLWQIIIFVLLILGIILGLLVKTMGDYILWEQMLSSYSFSFLLPP